MYHLSVCLLHFQRLLGQILSAVHQCHSRRVSHRDLKPANLLVDQKKYTLKVADSGFSIPHKKQNARLREKP
ncbi:hypothetical protein OIU77_012994 [Salix suchowensis]|uniref:non-specific serine/threonine protein kinase n=1 Tax=Salix suchowensis TaxID=1278906 RepID=A0ABQ9A6V7_9ROSI|nr:hypothetical protein OIU77_012994 [Salix suchowensis]